jgi:formamidopyrimidine-DNA glycosylase
MPEVDRIHRTARDLRATLYGATINRVEDRELSPAPCPCRGVVFTGGNVYKSEILFLERLNPLARVTELTDEK